MKLAHFDFSDTYTVGPFDLRKDASISWIADRDVLRAPLLDQGTLDEIRDIIKTDLPESDLLPNDLPPRRLADLKSALESPHLQWELMINSGKWNLFRELEISLKKVFPTWLTTSKASKEKLPDLCESYVSDLQTIRSTVINLEIAGKKDQVDAIIIARPSVNYNKLYLLLLRYWEKWAIHVSQRDIKFLSFDESMKQILSEMVDEICSVEIEKMWKNDESYKMLARKVVSLERQVWIQFYPGENFSKRGADVFDTYLQIARKD